jgi:DoxX-like family
MFILVVLIVMTLIARLAGISGVAVLDSWLAATRLGLCAMFLVAASAHFNSMRHDLARMVPPVFRHPLAMIYFTGTCEMLGAIGLLLSWTRIYAAAGLICHPTRQRPRRQSRSHTSRQACDAARCTHSDAASFYRADRVGGDYPSQVVP